MHFFLLLALGGLFSISSYGERALTASPSCPASVPSNGIMALPGVRISFDHHAHPYEQVLSVFIEAMSTTPKTVGSIYHYVDLGAGYFGYTQSAVIEGTIHSISPGSRGLVSKETKIVIKKTDGTFLAIDLEDMRSFTVAPSGVGFFAPATTGAPQAGKVFPPRTPLVWDGLGVDEAIGKMGESDPDAIKLCEEIFLLGGRSELMKLERLGVRGVQLAAIGKMYPQPANLMKDVSNSSEADLNRKFAAECKRQNLPQPVPNP